MLVISWSRKGKWPKNKVKYKITLDARDRLCRRKNLILDNGVNILLTLDKVVTVSYTHLTLPTTPYV